MDKKPVGVKDDKNVEIIKNAKTTNKISDELQKLEKKEDVSEEEQKEFEETQEPTESERKEEIELTPDEKRTKLTLIMKIRNAKYSFPKVDFGNVDFATLEDHSIKELEDMIVDITFIIRNRGASSLTQNMALKTIAMIEIATKNTPLKLGGMSRVLEKDEMFAEMVKEISWEYGGFTNIPAIYKLPLYLMVVGYSVHQINDRSFVVAGFLNEQCKPAIQEKYKNL